MKKSLVFLFFLIPLQALSIENGTLARGNELLVRHTVSIIRNELVNGAFVGGSCTGVIISSSVVLTAAHCVPEELSKSRAVYILFSHDVTNPATVARVRAKEVVVHHKYKHDKAYDLAILRFEGLPSFYAPIEIGYIKALNEQVLVAGYGVDKINKISNRLGFFETSISALGDFLFDTRSNAEGSTCDGDSGGPVFIKSNGELLLAGIITKGIKKDDRLPSCSDHSQNMRIEYFLPWIEPYLQ